MTFSPPYPIENRWQNLRIKAAHKIIEWEGYREDTDPPTFTSTMQRAYFRLAKLLDYEGGTLRENFTPEDAETCERLLGPYGHTLYRMLLAKRGLNDSQIPG